MVESDPFEHCYSDFAGDLAGRKHGIAVAVN